MSKNTTWEKEIRLLCVITGEDKLSLPQPATVPKMRPVLRLCGEHGTISPLEDSLSIDMDIRKPRKLTYDYDIEQE